jgi:putative sterol carrier protein
MVDPTVSEFMSRMAMAFVPEKALGIDATIQLKLTGLQAAEWYANIQDAKCEFVQGSAQSPKLTVTAASEDFFKIFTGQLDGMQAFMQGKIRILGDMNLALKLLSLFKMQ